MNFNLGMALPPDPNVAALLHDFIVNAARGPAGGEDYAHDATRTGSAFKPLYSDDERRLNDLEDAKGVSDL